MMVDAAAAALRAPPGATIPSDDMDKMLLTMASNGQQAHQQMTSFGNSAAPSGANYVIFKGHARDLPLRECPPGVTNLDLDTVKSTYSAAFDTHFKGTVDADSIVCVPMGAVWQVHYRPRPCPGGNLIPCLTYSPGAPQLLRQRHLLPPSPCTIYYNCNCPTDSEPKPDINNHYILRCMLDAKVTAQFNDKDDALTRSLSTAMWRTTPASEHAAGIAVTKVRDGWKVTAPTITHPVGTTSGEAMEGSRMLFFADWPSGATLADAHVQDQVSGFFEKFCAKELKALANETRKGAETYRIPFHVSPSCMLPSQLPHHRNNNIAYAHSTGTCNASETMLILEDATTHFPAAASIPEATLNAADVASQLLDNPELTEPAYEKIIDAAASALNLGNPLVMMLEYTKVSSGGGRRCGLPQTCGIDWHSRQRLDAPTPACPPQLKRVYPPCCIGTPSRSTLPTPAPGATSPAR